jgi:hypothetical protein
MKRSPFPLLFLTAFVSVASPEASGQRAVQSEVFTRPRTVGAAKQPTPPPAAPPSPTQRSAQAAAAQEPARTTQEPARTAPTQPGRSDAGRQDASPSSAQQPAAPAASGGGSGPVTGAAQTPGSVVPAAPSFPPAAPLQPARPLSLSRYRARLSEAQRTLKSRMQLTAATSAPSTFFVTIAAYDQEDSKIHLVTIPKQTLLKRGAEVTLSTHLGLPVRLTVIRPNYVNTAVVIADMQGRQLNPLVIEYPIEKGGRFTEMAYYTSAHPSLLSPEVVRHGKNYVRSMLNLAARRLKDKGKIISPQLIDIAERLCVVEHVDHQRFRTEDRRRLYEEVYALFALNELDTYRYSVSSAGAGGMVQMIPPTYAMVRRMHPSVGLNPDFVAGMRNHGNALEAMLLYMQDTWNDLGLNQDVLEAMANKQATQSELVAAGYNSNPARLPLYIRRGGAAWRTLIPRETQMYLQIYASVESLVEFKDRAKGGENEEDEKEATRTTGQ